MGDEHLVDSNVPMYAAGREHPLRGPCVEVLRRIQSGRLIVVTNAEVHQEILHRYLSIGLPDRAREVSRDFQILVPRVLAMTLDDVARARELTTSYPKLPSRDLIHVAVMLNNGVDTIISADHHFDTVAEITRLDPTDAAQSG